MISVVIPAYNREATIAQSLDSLVRQSYEGWEAIVVDDGSADGTAAVAEEYAARDVRFHVHRQANGGVSAARNAGIELARNPWLFLLDADDWIVPTAFEALLEGTRRGAEVGDVATGAHGVEGLARGGAADGVDGRGAVDVVYGGYVRIDEQGREARQRRPEPAEDLFSVFATTCAFSVHSCLTRTELARAVGAFDVTLVTCEDWDLWQRIARTGARFAAIPDYIAYYRMRTSSASVDGARMLDDGLRVIERGHGEDSRLAGIDVSHRDGVPAAPKAAVRAYFVCYAAGLAIAGGGDARPLLSALGPSRPVELTPSGVADTLFHAVANGRASVPEGWPEFPPGALERCRELVDELGVWAQDSWLGFQTRRELERMVLGVADGPRPQTVGSWRLVELDCEADPPVPLELEPVVRQLLCSVRCGSRVLHDVELPVCDGWLPPRVLADAVAADLGWDILRARLERDVYPTLEIERDGSDVRVSRAGCVLVEAGEPGEQPFADWLHDQLGWTALLQELWNRPTWPSDWFYSERPEPGKAPRLQASAGEPVAVELSEPLPKVGSDEPELMVGVTLAGIPLVTLRLAVRRGRIEPWEIRRATLMRLGFELCRAVVREVILAPATAEGTTLRESLAAAASAVDSAEPALRWAGSGEPPALVPGFDRALRELLPSTGGTAIGQRSAGADGTAISRYAVLPAAARDELLSAARGAGDPVLELGGAPADGPLVYVPGVQWDRSAARDSELEDEALVTQLRFEQTFASRPDPWDYASDYERRKYDQTLALVPDGVERALELGCAEGAFTAQLASRAQAVLACDVSTIALSRAARRCRDHANVTFAQLDLFRDELPSDHDLVVCSELLYYAHSRKELDRALDQIAQALRPGGQFLTANANVLVDDAKAPGFDWDVPFGAGGIGDAILAGGWFELVDETRAAPYRIQSYRRRLRRRRVPLGRGRRSGELTDAEAGEMTSEAAARYSPTGARVQLRDAEPQLEGDQKLPVLMYHRVAPDGSPRSERWRLRPEAFDQQLAFLRDEGYYSLGFEQWRAAANLRRPLPGKPIILTFDDGYADFPDHVAPALRRHGFRATVFVVAELVGQSNVWDAALGETLPLMDWDTIERLAAEGIDVGSHTARHRPLVALDPDELARDLARSRREIERHLGHPVTTLSYPFGLYDPLVRSIAGACGYEYAVTTDGWPASWSDGLLTLPRLEVRGTHSLSDFASLLAS
jgi:peptidoglycan/xylan/chitin deacetylase (PgdA/CDA1 family)/GT2 family glycosyltransferase/SAM-dependent methyltransferase